MTANGDNFLVLNQYRAGSSYKDRVGDTYHFPARYRKAIGAPPIWFIYYEPREGGDQVYFGAGRIVDVYEDSEDIEHFYADIADYLAFPAAVNYYAGAGSRAWEPAKTMRNSVRRLYPPVFYGILEAGGASWDTLSAGASNESKVQGLVDELAALPGPGHRSPPTLRKIRRILEAYERPSHITNHVKCVRGSSCQLCGTAGFLKRDGKPYCEVHHLFHLADEPPAEGLTPEYVVVLCATCHRRMHYGNVGQPVKTEAAWEVEVDGRPVIFVTGDK